MEQTVIFENWSLIVEMAAAIATLIGSGLALYTFIIKRPIAHANCIKLTAKRVVELEDGSVTSITHKIEMSKSERKATVSSSTLADLKEGIPDQNREALK